MKQLLVVLFLMLALFCRDASAETINCTNITSLPAVITTQGVYCLNQDISTNIDAGNALDVLVNNVTIDCNGHKIGNLAAGVDTQAVGIGAFQRSNITVRNCNLRGFWVGIAMSYNGVPDPIVPTGHVIEHNRVDNSTRVGIWVGGDSSVVRDNVVIGTGGNPGGDNAIAIETHFGTDVIDNLVDEVFDLSETPKGVYGIIAWSGSGNVIAGNRIRGLVSAGGIYGIMTTNDSMRMSIRDNVIVGGAGTGVGIDCIASTVIATGNHVNGFGSDLSNCVTSTAAPNVSVN